MADYSLGDGNAFDIIDDFKNTPFILTTGNGDEQISVKALKEGAYDYIVKDFERNFSKLLPQAILKALKMQETQKRLSVFEASLLHTNDAVVIADYLEETQLSISFVNEAFTNISGYNEAEALGKSLYLLVGEETSQSDIESINNAIIHGKAIRLELLFYKKNLQPFWANISLVPIRSNGDMHFVTIIRDVTERRKKEEELRKAKLQAEKARLAEQRFLNSISHEIRTPMNAILGMSHLLSDTDLNPKQHEYLKALKYSGEHLLNLMSDILDLTAMEANEMQLGEEQFNLFELLLDLQRTFSYQHKDKNFNVVMDLDISISNDVIGDEDRLKQILDNLLSNAVKFTEKGEIGIKVSLLNEKKEKYLLEFQVFDTGVGMAKDEIKNIFDNFRYANDTIHGKYGGSGLGLSIAKKLIELLGGNVWISSEVNKGTIVTFTLPLGNSGELSKMKTNENLLSQTDDELLKKLKVLVAEDNLMNQKLIAGLLNRWECHFDITNNGKEAIEQFGKLQYDMVFMDINMPLMNGYEAAAAIRNSPKNFRVPIVALTAAVLSTEKEKVFLSGMNEYVAKPFSPKKLKETVLKLIKTEKEIPIIIKQAETKKVEELASKEKNMLNINFEYLKEFSGGDTEFIKEMINMFVEQMPEEMELMQRLLNDENWEQLGKLAHKTKPNFLMMGMEVQQGMAKEIEHLCKESEIETEQVKTLTIQLIADAKAAIPVVEAELARLE